MAGGTVLTTTGNLTICASSTVTATATAQSLAIGLLDTDAAVAINDVSSIARANITDANLQVGGLLTIAAKNNTTATTTADGGTGGATAVGASGALSLVDVTTEATVDGATTINAAGIDILGTTTSSVNTVGIAAQMGSLNNLISPNISQQLLGTYTPGTAGGLVTVAAVVAVSDVNSSTVADLASTGVVTSTGPVNITTQSETDSHAEADGRNVGAGVGIGAAVGLNLVETDNTASLGGNLTAPSLLVTSVTPNTQTNTFSAEAYSGAGAVGVGVSGAYAQNDVDNNNSALLSPDANAAIDTSATLDADNVSQSTVNSSGLGLGGILGVGASVGLNIVDNGERAAIEDGATLTGVDSLLFDVDGDHQATTSILSGAAGGTATAAAVGVAVPSGGSEASIGSGSGIVISGPFDMQVNRVSVVNTTVDGEAVGPGVGVGASFGLTGGTEIAEASVNRDLSTTGNATIHASIDSMGTTSGVGSEQGAAALGRYTGQHFGI